MICSVTYTLAYVKSSRDLLNANYTLFVPKNPEETLGKLEVESVNSISSLDETISSDFIIIIPLISFLFSNVTLPVMVWLFELIIWANSI